MIRGNRFQQEHSKQHPKGGSLQRKIVVVLGVLALLWIIGVTVYMWKAPPRPSTGPKLPLRCPTINLVYTWVNGSDPRHIEQRIQRAGNHRWAAPGNNRFRDLDGLLYSLRSAEMYAPWLGKIFIVTDGQVPGFLNTDHPKIEVISHRQIFENPDHDLPTFNSNAIEINFHNLPDRVGPCFIYLNDDMFFGNHVEPSDFWEESKGQILFQSTWTAPPSKDKLSNLWHRSILNTNNILDSMWGKDTRHYASHGPYFFNLAVLRHICGVLGELCNITSTHPFRHEFDGSVPFLYNNWVEHYYESTVAPQTINMYMKITDDFKRAMQDFERILAKRPKTVCMNDGMDEINPSPKAIEAMHNFFLTLFPNPSAYEKPRQP